MACLNDEFKDFTAKNFSNVFGGVNVITGVGRDNGTVAKPGEVINMTCANGMMLSNDSTLNHVHVSIYYLLNIIMAIITLPKVCT